MKSLFVVQFAAMAVVMLALLEVGVTTATEGAYREKKGKLGMSILEALKKHIIDGEQERALQVKLGASLRHTDTDKKTNTKKGVCNADQFKCDNGECLDFGELNKCDGWVACADGSDEENCVCTTEQFKCQIGGCIHVNQVCNQAWDCQFGSDENRDNCGICLDNQFQCSNELCYYTWQRCDGKDDCGDNSDEENCGCKSPREFECTNGKCILNVYVCDSYGIDHCGDNSDEENCDCGPKQWKCHNGQRCIRPGWVCDGWNDCGDNSDEEGCNCQDLQWMCSIPSWQTHCCKKEEDKVCKPNEFLCSNRNCINKSALCDNNNDCGDLSDEQCGRFR